MYSYLTRQEFQEHLEWIDKSPYVAVDTEGTLNHPFAQTWGISTSARGKSEYFAFHHMTGDNLPLSWLPKLKRCLENHPCLIFHHAKHDLRSLKAVGIEITGKFYDVMLMSHMTDENRFSQKLDSLSQAFGGQPKKSTDLMKRIIDNFGWDHIPVELMREYGANDAFITEELFNNLIDDFQEQGFDGDLWDIEQKFVRLLCKIEDQGVLIDQDLSQRELERGLGIMDKIQSSLGFNPGSTKELGRFLLNDLGLPVVKKTPAGNPSFDRHAMEEYDLKLAKMGDSRARQILTYRGWQKTTSSNYKAYLDLVREDGRLHPNFKQHGTTTGRLSCEKPNLQQIPRKSANDWNGGLKRVFISDPGRTRFEADYSQLELRLVAAYAQEQALIEIFNDDERDFFTETSQQVKMTRDQTKTLIYTIQYGGGPKRIKDVFDINWQQAKRLIDNFYSTYPGIDKVNQVAQNRCRQNGYVSTWTGRRRHFRYPKDEYYKAMSAVIQGGAFEIVKRQMIKADEEGLNNPECAMDLQVHDSACFDIEEGKEKEYVPEIKRVLEDVDSRFGVRFKVQVKEWGT